MIRPFLLGAALALAPASLSFAESPKPAAVQVAGLTLSDAFTRATLPGAPVAGGFVTIANAGSADDRLIGGKADFATEVQVHEMALQGDVMKMRELPDGLPIPAGQTVVLKPGSYHVMFMGLTRPLTEGETVDVTLTFEKAGDVALKMAVIAPGKAHMGAGKPMGMAAPASN